MEPARFGQAWRVKLEHSRIGTGQFRDPRDRNCLAIAEIDMADREVGALRPHSRQGPHINPADYRRRATAAPAQSTSSGCLIKGNISGSGEIYHMPGQLDYAGTRISARNGERWFCSKAGARAAGWRPDDGSSGGKPTCGGAARQPRQFGSADVRPSRSGP